MSSDMAHHEAMTKYVGEQVPIDLIAEAWRYLSDPDQDGRGNRLDLDDYLYDEWSKDAKRVIRGFAETNERPTRWPWTDERFNGFDWLRRLISGGGTAARGAGAGDGDARGARAPPAAPTAATAGTSPAGTAPTAAGTPGQGRDSRQARARLLVKIRRQCLTLKRTRLPGHRPGATRPGRFAYLGVNVHPGARFDDDQPLTTAQAAQAVNVSPHAVRKWRTRGYLDTDGQRHHLPVIDHDPAGNPRHRYGDVRAAELATHRSSRSHRRAGAPHQLGTLTGRLQPVT